MTVNGHGSWIWSAYIAGFDNSVWHNTLFDCIAQISKNNKYSKILKKMNSYHRKLDENEDGDIEMNGEGSKTSENMEEDNVIVDFEMFQSHGFEIGAADLFFCPSVSRKMKFGRH